MRNQQSWLVLAATGMVLLVGIVLLRARQATSERRSTTTGAAAASATSRSGVAGKPESYGTAPPAAETDAEQAADDAERELRIARYIAEGEKEMAHANIPTEFEGRVVDQANEPIPGVEIAYESSAYTPDSGGNMQRTKGNVLTDANGDFSIRGLRGHSLSITRLTKHGYAAPGNENKHYTYALLSTQGGDVYRPKANAPALYKMALLGEPQPLWTFENRLELPVNGPPVRSDTANGQLARPFRLQFQAGQPASEKKSVYDWTLTLQLEGGRRAAQYRRVHVRSARRRLFRENRIGDQGVEPGVETTRDNPFFCTDVGGALWPLYPRNFRALFC